MIFTEWRKERNKWKQNFPLHLRILYFLVGYPPKPFELPDQVWKEWEARFDLPSSTYSHKD